jgi:hypothetical protein
MYTRLATLTDDLAARLGAFFALEEMELADWAAADRDSSLDRLLALVDLTTQAA